MTRSGYPRDRTYPPEILESALHITRTFAKRAAQRRHVYDMVELLEFEKEFIERWGFR